MKLIPSAALAAITLLAGGCADSIVFMERTHAGLSVQVAGDPTEPFEIDAGYKRKIVAVVSPQERPDRTENDDGETVAKGEALSLLSRFDLAYTKGGTATLGDGKVINGFATGEAARILSKNPARASAFLGIPPLTCATEKLDPGVLGVRGKGAAYVRSLVKNKSDDMLITFGGKFGVSQPKGAFDDTTRDRFGLSVLSTIMDLCSKKDIERMAEIYKGLTGDELSEFTES